MKLPSELNPRVETRLLAGGTPVYDITLNFNGEDHVYTVAELSDFSTINVMLKAMDDGYGEDWVKIGNDTTPRAAPQIIENDDLGPAEAVPAIEEQSGALPNKTKKE